MSETADGTEFEALLEYLKRTRGFDFGAYKTAGLMRRVRKRLYPHGLSGFNEYLDFLEVHPEEFASLFDAILINVTSFFRDPAAWDYVRKEVLPRILEAKPAGAPIRVWSAGCASGEETYTAAMVLAEAIESGQFCERVKIYATDLDEQCLEQARQAGYPDAALEGVPGDLRDRYFTKAGALNVFDQDLRRAVIFGRHDLIEDAPISRVDLLICRNTLMYFNSEAQKKILGRFHFALGEGGFLFLGKAEMLLTHASKFTPVELKHRVFSKVAPPKLKDRLLIAAHDGREDAGNDSARNGRLREMAFDMDPVAQVLVDAGGDLIVANEQARMLFNLAPGDQGRRFQDLEIAYRPLALRPSFEKALVERRPVAVKGVAHKTASGEDKVLDVSLIPLLELGGTSLGTKIVFLDVTLQSKIEEDIQQANQELETAHEEIQTTNEELQSTNEELRTLNEELHQRSDELNHVNAFLNSVLTSLRSGVIVVDRDLRILVWSHKAEDLWGLRADEVEGRNLLNLDFGLKATDLKKEIRGCLSGESDFQEVIREATNRRGRTIDCRVMVTPLVGVGKEIRGAILLMEENPGGKTAEALS